MKLLFLLGLIISCSCDSGGCGGVAGGGGDGGSGLVGG